MKIGNLSDGLGVMLDDRLMVDHGNIEQYYLLDRLLMLILHVSYVERILQGRIFVEIYLLNLFIWNGLSPIAGMGILFICN